MFKNILLIFFLSFVFNLLCYSQSPPLNLTSPITVSPQVDMSPVGFDQNGKAILANSVKSPTEIANTIVHEINHNGGLGHPWQANQPADIAQYGPAGFVQENANPLYTYPPKPLNLRSDVTNTTITNNIQNSAANPDTNLKSKKTDTANQLTLGQVKAIDQNVQSDTKKNQ